MHAATLSQAPSLLQEAALHYADGLEHEALRRLQALTQDRTNPPSQDGWNALLDLARLMGNKEDFDLVAAAYRQHFAGSTPLWDPLVDENRLLPDLREGGAAFVPLAGDLDITSAIALNAHDALSRHAVVRIDGSGLAYLDKQACSVLLDTIVRMVDAGGGIHLTGVTRLVHCVTQLIQIDITFRPAWDLLLKLWQIKGEEREYHRIALEYCLGFGIHPPAWEPIVAPMVDVPNVEEKRESPRYGLGRDVMRMVGNVVGAQSFYLKELQSFAIDRKYVNVDLSLLRRIDGAAAHALVKQTNDLIMEGKVVRLLRQHSLIHGMLRFNDISSSVVCSPLSR